MRIIHGKFKGFQFPEFHGDNTRPTSDLLKESLFNILEARIDFRDLTVVDLFAGTGNLGIECLSRGAGKLVSVDSVPKNTRYMSALSGLLKTGSEWEIVRKDAIDFVQGTLLQADLILADPPYAYAAIHELVRCVLESELYLARNAVFVLEHADRLVFKHKHVFLNKQYGSSAFTCFRSAGIP